MNKMMSYVVVWSSVLPLRTAMMMTTTRLGLSLQHLQQPAVKTRCSWLGYYYRLARHCLCRQSCLGFSSITFISSNWNDKLRSYSWDPSTLPVSTNPCQRGEIWWHSYRGERGHLQLLLQQRIPQNCWPNYSKFPNEIQSKQIIEIWDGIIEVVHQELYGNLNIWGLVIWQTFWPLLSFFQIRFHTILCW